MHSDWSRTLLLIAITSALLCAVGATQARTARLLAMAQ